MDYINSNIGASQGNHEQKLQEARERELEQALISRMRDFLHELGGGFAFVGSQHPRAGYCRPVALSARAA